MKPLEGPHVGYLAAEGFEAQLDHDLRGREVVLKHGRLRLVRGAPEPMPWARNTWLAPEVRRIASIGDAARTLKAVQRNWVPLPVVAHRRVALIGEKLPFIRFKPHPFGAPPPTAPLGSFTLLDRDTMLFSGACSAPFAHGEIAFDEDTEGPPSRAYRKLWEVFTLYADAPAAGARCLDIGASPGGWTWVLAEAGANVVAVDKAPLDPAIAARPNVDARQGSAFALSPAEFEAPFDWFFSDVICYPARLLALVERFREAGAAKRFVCTLKFQGETDHETAARFAAIPGSRLVHLAHNRHELTWIWLGEHAH